MLAPDRLAGRSAIDAKDVVRVALEPRGIIGFIQIPALESHAMTLAEARTIIAATIDHVPDDVQFLYGDAGLPIGRAQEPYHHVADHYPCIKLRPAPSIAKKLKPTTCKDSTNGMPLDDTHVDQISVTHGQSKSLFVSWIPSTYTFQQLRRDAARYWDIPHDAATLVDQDGCAWPDEASIASTLLENDVLAAKTRLILRHKKLLHGPTIVANRPRVPTKNLDERLWYIFTFYCVHGDALDVLGMTAYQFHRFLRDCRLFSSAFTPAMGDVIYAFEAKGKLAKPLAASRRATAKLDYDGFLNALATMATRRYANDALPTLLSTHVLPRASSWPLHTWQFHTSLLQQDDVARFVLKFEPMLRDIFVFYTNQPFSEAEVESTMAFSDYVRFVNDFHITELLLSTHECPELFLASCQCTGRRDTMHFDAFLDVLGRAGLVGLTRYRPLQPLQCVKAVFHHMTRGLKSSRALEIIANHGPSALYAARFYAGCVAFSHKFLDVWRIEGSPDYITGVLPILPDKSTHGRDMLAQMMVRAEAAPVAPLPPPGSPPMAVRPPSAPAMKTMTPTKAKTLGAPRDRPPLVASKDRVQKRTPFMLRGPRLSRLSLDEHRLTLTQGNVFRKFGTWGQPQRRYVWCSDESDALSWRSLKSKKTEESLSLYAIQAVLPGNTETTKYAFMKHLSDEKNLRRCFSIITKDRRLDLEADSDAICDRWIQALTSYLESQRA